MAEKKKPPMGGSPRDAIMERLEKAKDKIFPSTKKGSETPGSVEYNAPKTVAGRNAAMKRAMDELGD